GAGGRVRPAACRATASSSWSPPTGQVVSPDVARKFIPAQRVSLLTATIAPREVHVSDEMPLSYARAVGDRLRNLRRQQSLSLLAVEEASGREFKASVLGAYERGERIISVLRLQRLAQLYG